MAAIVARVMKPNPPTWTSTRTVSWPANDQWPAKSSGVSPVTHTADTAVNSASMSGVGRPSAAMTGSLSSAVPSAIMAANPKTSTRGGDAAIHWNIRPITVSPPP